MKFLLFADEVKLYIEVYSILDQMRLQDKLIGLLRWCSDNFLSLNKKKQVLMPFTRSKNLFLTTGLDSTS